MEGKSRREMLCGQQPVSTAQLGVMREGGKEVANAELGATNKQRVQKRSGKQQASDSQDRFNHYLLGKKVGTVFALSRQYKMGATLPPTI